MALRIITDSSCDLPRAEAERLGVEIVPCNIHFGAQTLRDGVDIQPAAFYERLANDLTHPTTSQPSAGAFLEVFQRLTGQGHEVAAIMLSSKLSGTYNSAMQARQEAGPRARIEVVDSLQASLALGVLVRAAARMAQAGATAASAAAMVRRDTPSIRCYFTVDTLKYLVRGGRASRIQGFFGSLLDIKPLLVLRDGEVHPVERVRSRRRLLDRLRELAAGCADVQAIGVVHSVCPQDAKAVLDHCRTLFPSAETLLSEFTPVLGVHLGPKALGLTVWGKAPSV